mgnify:CR=1 FL=1
MLCILPTISIKTESVTLGNILKGVPHGIHQVVEVINGPVQLLPGLGVSVPSIVADFSDEIHTTGMHNDVIVLNEVNPVVDAVFPLAGLTDTFQPQFPQTVNRLRFSRISRDFLFQIAHSPHFIRYCFVAHAGLIHFIKEIGRAHV